MIVNNKYLISFFCVLLLLSIASASAFAQQAFTYTQYSENLTPVNHAFSLLNPNGAVELVARKQWVGINGAPATLIADGYIPVGDNGTATSGLTVLHDQVGTENLTEANAFFAKSVQISATDYVALSLNAGVRRYTTDYASLDPYDPELKNDIRETVANTGFGIILYGKDENDENKYYAGISVPRISLATLGGSGAKENRYLKNQFYISGGFFKPVSDEIKVKPAILVSYADNVPLQGDFSTMLYLQDKFGLGFNYRTNNEIGLMLSADLGETIHIGYSYQMAYGQNKLGSLGNDTHEIGISYRINQY